MKKFEIELNFCKQQYENTKEAVFQQFDEDIKNIIKSELATFDIADDISSYKSLWCETMEINDIEKADELFEKMDTLVNYIANLIIKYFDINWLRWECEEYDIFGGIYNNGDMYIDIEIENELFGSYVNHIIITNQ